jgi:hypothetical protein
MKPANFPGRKNDRRIRALSRMDKPRGLSLAAQAQHPYFITRCRVLPDHVARGIRTKKDRTHRASFARS